MSELLVGSKVGVTVLTALGDNDWLGDAVSVELNNAVFVFEAV
jgi:hypothetical protein